MLDLIKKTLLTGVGLAAVTKEKIEELGKELAKSAELSEKEGRELVDDLTKRREQAQKDLQERMDKTVRETVDRLHLASKEDIAVLTRKVETLEQKLAERGDA